ncbi:MAG: zinc ribbon domain-containing protein [Candidatus Pacearchaeota archaeon]|nr:zinc ribbon domain-containing protein [Candidatus Pacearchaeota archaeon]
METGEKICQSCGMPMKVDEDKGTNFDDTKSEEYCKYCYKDGKFIDEGISLKDKIEKNVQIAMKMGMSEEKAQKMANDTIPNLKRWKK